MRPRSVYFRTSLDFPVSVSSYRHPSYGPTPSSATTGASEAETEKPSDAMALSTPCVRSKLEPWTAAVTNSRASRLGGNTENTVDVWSAVARRERFDSVQAAEGGDGANGRTR
eukprot:3115640-Rhodomonas_salina.4